MTIHPPPPARAGSSPDASTPLDKLLRAFSILTLAMTVPQAWGVWFGRDIGGVSLISWATYLLSAVLWFFYGLRKRDKTIYLACIGWIVLDAAIVAGVIARGGA